MSEGSRPLRADARRKREAIIDAAALAFAEGGVEIALETVARRADVGIGTLYRHFPTRDALITQVYLREIDHLCNGLDELIATTPIDQALMLWMQRFIGYVGTKRGMALAVKTIAADPAAPAFRESHERVHAAMSRLVELGQREGRFRDDIASGDLVMAMTGFCLVTDAPGRQDRADRLVALLVDGLKHGANR